MLFLFVFHNSCSELYKFTKQILLKLSPRLIVPNCFYHTHCKICSWSHVYFQYQNLKKTLSPLLSSWAAPAWTFSSSSRSLPWWQPAPWQPPSRSPGCTCRQGQCQSQDLGQCHVLIKTDYNFFRTILMRNKRPGIQLFFEVRESLPVVGILPGNNICVKSNIYNTDTFDLEICLSFPPFTDSFWQFSCIFVPFLHLSCFACLFGLFVMEFFSFR